jgi:Kef-type K+ transport system membrane component KefB
MPGAAGAIERAKLLRHDALAAAFAGLLVDDVAAATALAAGIGLNQRGDGARSTATKSYGADPALCSAILRVAFSMR